MHQVRTFILEKWSKKALTGAKIHLSQKEKNLSRTTDMMIPKRQKYNLKLKFLAHRETYMEVLM